MSGTDWNPYADMSDEALRRQAAGCTELTCMCHGAFNLELSRREHQIEVTS